MADLDAPLNITPYSEEELNHFKELLEEELETVNEQFHELRDLVGELTDQQDDTYSSVAHHQADLGTDEEEKETNYKEIERLMSKRKDIKAALDKIEKGTYGVCEDTGEKIQKERLETIPYTRYCVEARKRDDEFQRPPQV